MKQIALLGMGMLAAIGFATSVAWPEFAISASPEDDNVSVKSTARKTDLNFATVRELSKLPGIGKELAERIVRQRPYRKLDELIAKKVLGRKQFARIKGRIRVSSVP